MHQAQFSGPPPQPSEEGAVGCVAEHTGLSKNELYAAALEQ